MGGKTCFVFQNNASRGGAKRQTETTGRSALPAEDKRRCRIRRICTNGKDETAIRCILMLFVEVEDMLNKPFHCRSFVEYYSTEIRRADGYTEHRRNIDIFDTPLKLPKNRPPYTLAKMRLNGTTLVRLTDRMATIRTDFLPKS